MAVISNAAYIEAGKRLLTQSQTTAIPYVAGGMTLAGMDCQGLVEYLLIQCGLTKAEVNLAGSNAHWRQSCKWQGTPEEAVKLFGCVPAGAALFIWTEQETAKYMGDGMGDANHMGIYLGGNSAIHASSSRGCVAESEFKGKTIPNGGWNRVGLLKWVRYGTAWELEQSAVVDDTETDRDALLDANESVASPASQPRYVRVKTADGNGVRAREQPNLKAIYKYTVPEGTILQVLADKGSFWRVHYLGKARYVDKRFVVEDRG